MRDAQVLPSSAAPTELSDETHIVRDALVAASVLVVVLVLAVGLLVGLLTPPLSTPPASSVGADDGLWDPVPACCVVVP